MDSPQILTYQNIEDNISIEIFTTLNPKEQMQEPNPQFQTYQNKEGDIKLDVRMVDDSVWLSIPQLAELFGEDESKITALIEEGYSDNGKDDELILDFNDQRTFVDATNNAEIVCYNLIIIRYVGFFIDYPKFFHFFTWAAKLLEEDILKNINDNPDDLQSKNPGVKYLKLRSRLMAMDIDISFDLPDLPPERISIELAEGVWLTNDDEILAYEKKKKSGEIPLDPIQN